MNGGLVRLREIIGTITPSERKVASFILEHPRQLVGLSVAQLAEQSGGSQAAVIRLCKSAGFKGYQELMLKVAGDLRDESPIGGYQEIHPADSIQQIIEQVSLNTIQSIRDTVKVLNPLHVEQAIEALNRAQRLFFFGTGASHLVASDAQHKFLRINKPGFAFSDTDRQLIASSMLTPEDTVIGISYSGQTTVTTECMKIARDAGATTISITRYGSNAVSNLAMIPLYISALEDEIRSGATSSRITQLNVIDILYLGVASRSYHRSLDYLEQSRHAVQRMKG
ncbi:MurR/RpiR family transcriptional regulator [Paenibacillus wulumuqiensis]|uniref:MurR/RpiR family transcriptional regulator n=1 Tax=Paenibacillus wulumuqiensis TaxID=1567107 RepID=UPI00061918DF|nr:MurR/RpiR family transcriptional regulator [Paenibacillus wulumuqiensis]